MTLRITRRQLGIAAASAAAMSGTSATPITAEPVTKDHTLDPVYWTLESYQSAPLQLTFNATNKQEAQLWQQRLRTKLTELLGGFPARTPLTPQTLEVRDFPTYRREKFIFQSQPGVSVLAYLLTSHLPRCASPNGGLRSWTWPGRG